MDKKANELLIKLIVTSKEELGSWLTCLLLLCVTLAYFSTYIFARPQQTLSLKQGHNYPFFNETMIN